MEITKETRKALLAFLNNKPVIACWGMSNIRIAPNTITFNVKGLLYSGSVSIECYSPNNYTVRFGNNLPLFCTLQNLVGFIDVQIERSPDYIEDVTKWIVDMIEK